MYHRDVNRSFRAGVKYEGYKRFKYKNSKNFVKKLNEVKHQYKTFTYT